MSSLTQDQLEQLVLNHLFERANEGQGRASAAEIAARLGAPEPRVAMALRSLSGRKLAQGTHNYVSGSSYQISEDGYRKVEASAIAPSQESSIAAEEHERVLHQLIPASDRIVSPSHNSPDFSRAIEEVEEAQRLIASSNQLPEEDKKTTLVHLDAGLLLLRKSKEFAVGAVRYLILDRLKAAFEGAVEDAFKVVITGAFMALTAVLVAML